MSEQAMVPVAIPSIYSITDHYDEQQIAAIDSALREKLVYEVRNEKRLSYYGVKWLVLKMADKGHPLGFMSKPEVTLVKFDEHDEEKWIWMAMVHMYNKKTTSEAYGLQESPYHEFIRNKQTGKWTSIGYDRTGRTKAVSKATRNASRQLIPEVECELLLNTVLKEQTLVIREELGELQDLDTKPGTKSMTAGAKPTGGEPSGGPPPSEGQLKYLKGLGHKGPAPKTMGEASAMIDALLGKKPNNGGQAPKTGQQSKSGQVDNTTPPSESQLKYLKDLGYKGPTPKTMDEAGDKINELKTGTKPKPTAQQNSNDKESKVVNGGNVTPPSEGQLKYLKSLGYNGPDLKTMAEAGAKIDELNGKKKPAQEVKPKDSGSSNKPTSSSVTAPTDEQIADLKTLEWDGDVPASKYEAGLLINSLRREK